MAPTEGTYEIRGDTAENRLYITLSGLLDEGAIATAADMAIETARGLDSGFDVIIDATGFRPSGAAAAAPVEAAQSALADLGIDRVVRITDDETSTIVRNAFERRSRDVGYGWMATDSVADAERLLR